MPGTIAASSSSAWTYGGAILTFVFPMILFLAVAVTLYVVYTKPSVVPGHREQTIARPIGFTPVVRPPRRDSQTGAPVPGGGPHYAFPGRAGQPATGAGGQADGPENPAAPPSDLEGAE